MSGTPLKDSGRAGVRSLRLSERPACSLTPEPSLQHPPRGGVGPAPCKPASRSALILFLILCAVNSRADVLAITQYSYRSTSAQQNNRVTIELGFLCVHSCIQYIQPGALAKPHSRLGQISPAPSRNTPRRPRARRAYRQRASRVPAARRSDAALIAPSRAESS